MAPRFAHGKICSAQIPALDVERSAGCHEGGLRLDAAAPRRGDIAFDDDDDDDGVVAVSGTWVTGTWVTGRGIFEPPGATTA